MVDIIKLSEPIKADSKIDGKRLNRPIPLLIVKKELGKVAKGAIVQLDCTDVETRQDLQSWCKRIGYQYMGEKQQGNCLSFFIKK